MTLNAIPGSIRPPRCPCVPYEYAVAHMPEGELVGRLRGDPMNGHLPDGCRGSPRPCACSPNVRAVFDKLGEIHDHPAATGLHGRRRRLPPGATTCFKTSTFLCPAHLREYVFPIYAEMARIAHEAGKPFILHSCGNLDAVYDDLIDGCGIDAKHSFEDVILPVTEFKRCYGDRVTPLGGLDVDFICRASEPELRRYVRQVAEVCYADGFWALGTGNSLTDYMPVENYLIVLEEGKTL